MIAEGFSAQECELFDDTALVKALSTMEVAAEDEGNLNPHMVYIAM